MTTHSPQDDNGGINWDAAWQGFGKTGGDTSGDDFAASFQRIAHERGAVQDLAATPAVVDPRFTPIRHLVPEPVPGYNSRIEQLLEKFDGKSLTSDDVADLKKEEAASIDVILTIREGAKAARIDPNVIVPVRETFLAWGKKLSDGISDIVKDSGADADQYAGLGQAIAIVGLERIITRTIGQNLEPAWVPSHHQAFEDPTFIEQQARSYRFLYDIHSTELLKLAGQQKALALLPDTEATRDDIQDHIDRFELSLLSPELIYLEKTRKDELLGQKKDLQDIADPEKSGTEISSLQQQIATINDDVRDQWTTEQRLQKTASLNSLRAEKALIDRYENPGNRQDDLASAQATLDDKNNPQSERERGIMRSLIEKIHRYADTDKRQQASDEIDLALEPLAVEEKLQLPSETYIAKLVKRTELQTRLEHITIHQDPDISASKIGDIDFEIALIEKRMSIGPTQKLAQFSQRVDQRVETLIAEQASLAADPASDETAEKQAKNAEKILMLEGDRENISNFGQQEDLSKIEEARNFYTEKNKGITVVRAGIGTVLNGVYLSALEAGLSKSTAQWAAGLMYDVLKDEKTPKWAPRDEWPIEGLKPADELVPANRLAEITHDSRTKPFTPSPAPENLATRAAEKFVDVDQVLFRAIKILGGEEDGKAAPQQTDKQFIDEINLGISLNRNGGTIRRVVNQWIQDGHIDGYRRSEIDPASDILTGLNVRAKDLQHAVAQTYQDGSSVTRITFNTSKLEPGTAETWGGKTDGAFIDVDGQERIAVTFNRFSLNAKQLARVQNALSEAVGLELSEATVYPDQPEEGDPVSFNKIPPRYVRGQENLFPQRREPTFVPLAPILAPVNDNQKSVFHLLGDQSPSGSVDGLIVNPDWKNRDNGGPTPKKGLGG